MIVAFNELEWLRFGRNLLCIALAISTNWFLVRVGETYQTIGEVSIVKISHVELRFGAFGLYPLRKHVSVSKERKLKCRICFEVLEACRCWRLGLKGCGGGGWDSWMMTERSGWESDYLLAKRFDSWRVAPIETPPLFDSLNLWFCIL